MLFFMGIKRAAPVSLSKRLLLVFPWLHAELLLLFRPEVAEFQEHAVYLSRIMHVVTPQTEMCRRRLGALVGITAHSSAIRHFTSDL